MNYADVRLTVADGDVLAFTHRWRWTWYDIKCMAVRMFTMSDYSHVGVAVWVEDRLWLLESVTPFVRLVPLSGELPCYVVSGRGLTPAQRARGIALIGKGQYSQIEAIKAYWGGNSALNDAWECAEFVKHVLDLDCVATPSEVVNSLLYSGATVRYIK